MLSGKQFRLGCATLALELAGGRHIAVTVPVGAVIRVISGPLPENGLVNVDWDSRNVQMFEIDINRRGTEILDLNAGA